MRQYCVRLIFLVLLLSAVVHPSVLASVTVGKYGVSFTAADSAVVRRTGRTGMDSLLKAGPLKVSAAIYNIQRQRSAKNRTPDFYLLTGLCLILGFIRFSDSRYFSLLIGAYRSAGTRQWQDMLQGAALPNLGMNIFFSAVAGAYIYYLTTGTNSHLLTSRSPLVLLILIAGMMLMYAGKYAVIRFSGWAFRVESLAGEYLFNVFLINKIIGIVLLPFVIIIAFAGQDWLQPMSVLSGVVVLGLLATRYLRSWSAFYAFFKGSRFHFFTYLCASEILPMAVLVKWLLHLLR